jgi:hypothetical protein
VAAAIATSRRNSFLSVSRGFLFGAGLVSRFRAGSARGLAGHFGNAECRSAVRCLSATAQLRLFDEIVLLRTVVILTIVEPIDLKPFPKRLLKVYRQG